jgi:voltage-gated potassium channel
MVAQSAEMYGVQAMDEVKDAREDRQASERQRWQALHDLEEWLERPIQWLALAWIALLVVEFVWGLTPLLDGLVWAIWALFVGDFALRLALAPKKWQFLQGNWLTLISLAVPALRIFAMFKTVRLLRLSQTVRGARLVRVVSSVNRSMNTLRAYLLRHRLGYILALTALVMVAGAAGMWALEGAHVVAGGFAGFGDAFWWTAMIMTTIGSAYWPQTPEGRVLTFLLSAYALSIFGYITAFLATFFIGRDAHAQPAPPTAPTAAAIAELTAQVEALRRELHAAQAAATPGPPIDPAQPVPGGEQDTITRRPARSPG